MNFIFLLEQSKVRKSGKSRENGIPAPAICQDIARFVYPLADNDQLTKTLVLSMLFFLVFFFSFMDSRHLLDLSHIQNLEL